MNTNDYSISENKQLNLIELNYKKIDCINSSIDTIINELNNIKQHCKILNYFSNNLKEITKNDFIENMNSINESIKIINEIEFSLEINKLKKIIKTESGSDIEITDNDFDNSYNQNKCKNQYKNQNIKTKDSHEETNQLQKIISDDYFIDNIEFNADLLNDKKILCQTAYNIFTKNINLEKIKINSNSLKKFIYKVSKHYYSNYYHNFKHVIMVLQFVHLIFKKINIKDKLGELEIFAIMISCLVHDIDHPGHTNTFEINTRSNLALKYNNKSVLENHHCSLTFYLIHSKEINLLENLDENEFIIVRDMIIECILSTDIKLHHVLLEDFESRFYSGFDFNNIQDKLFFGKIIVHVADLSNQLRPFDICFKGSMDLRKEYMLQVKKEIELGLPVLEYMKLEKDKQFYLSEIYFSSNIVKPMWNILVQLYPQLNNYHLNLEININRWKELVNQTNDDND